MVNLISHIEYLIQQHDCVIVAGLGGFVLNRNAAKVKEDGSILPPTARVGFNVALSFNDGLLAESLMKVDGITYNQALAQIDRVVKEIISELNRNKSVSIGTLGELKKENGILVFKPNKTLFYHPDTWGNFPLNLKYIDLIKEDKDIVVKKKTLSPRLKYTWSGVAALFTGILLYSSFNTTALKNIQLSGFYLNSSVPTELALKMTRNSIIENDSSFMDRFISQKKVSVVIEQEPKEEIYVVEDTIRTTPIFEKRYFIVIGGDTDKNRAEKLLLKFKREGFKNASIVETSGRFRIYSRSFADKNQANAYLDKFRADNLSFNDAWLYTKKVQIN